MRSPSKRGARTDRRRPSLRDDLLRAGVTPSRRRGQSFLRDESVAERQGVAARITPGDRVLEVGGGLGVLTKELARRGAAVRVIEVEPALASALRALTLPGVEVVEGDALEADLGHPRKVVANLPFALSTPLVERLLDTGAETMVLLLQKEFAERLAASPGSKEWSRLGALVQRDYEVELLEVVPPDRFVPQPSVHCAVVRLARRGPAMAPGARDYRELVGALFGVRRKKIRNSIARAAARFGVEAGDAVEVAEAQGVADARPEELSCVQFEALSQALAQRRTHK